MAPLDEEGKTLPLFTSFSWIRSKFCDCGFFIVNLRATSVIPQKLKVYYVWDLRDRKKVDCCNFLLKSLPLGREKKKNSLFSPLIRFCLKQYTIVVSSLRAHVYCTVVDNQKTICHWNFFSMYTKIRYLLL